MTKHKSNSKGKPEKQGKSKHKKNAQGIPVISQEEAQEIRNDPHAMAAIQIFLDEYERVQSLNPGMPASAMDMSSVGRVIAQHPQLAAIAEEVQQRDTARRNAMMPDALYSGSPTGSSPIAAQQNSSKWAGSENDPLAVANAKTLRRWSDENEWVRAAMGIRRKQIERMRPICMPVDPKKRFNPVVQKKIQALIDQPNELRDSWRSLIGPILEDILALDRGVMLKNMTLKREPVALYYEDGACIRIYPAWSGDPDEPRYLYVSPDNKVKKALRNDECIVIMDNAATYRYGLSPIQALQNTIQADLAATAAAAHMVSMKPPPHALQIPGLQPDQIKKLADNYAAKIAGKKELFFFGGKEAAHLFPLVFSAKDNQWLEWQVYLARKIAVLFQISPQKLGILNDVNRATANVQEEIDEDRGLIPLLLLIEEYMNRELLSDFAPKLPDDRTNLDALNLKVVYPEVSDTARKLHARDTVALAAQANPGLPSMTINMILAMLGADPMDGGDTLYSTAPPIKWLSYDEPLEDMPQNQPEPAPVIAAPQAPEANGDPADADDDAPQIQDDDAGGSPSVDNASKDSGLTNYTPDRWFDMRSPGSAWRPERNAFTTKAASSGRKKIPAKQLKKLGKSKAQKNAEDVLENALNTVFKDVLARGNKG